MSRRKPLISFPKFDALFWYITLCHADNGNLTARCSCTLWS